MSNCLSDVHIPRRRKRGVVSLALLLYWLLLLGRFEVLEFFIVDVDLNIKELLLEPKGNLILYKVILFGRRFIFLVLELRHYETLTQDWMTDHLVLLLLEEHPLGLVRGEHGGVLVLPVLLQ